MCSQFPWDILIVQDRTECHLDEIQSKSLDDFSQWVCMDAEKFGGQNVTLGDIVGQRSRGKVAVSQYHTLKPTLFNFLHAFFLPGVKHQSKSMTCTVCGACYHLRQAHRCHGDYEILGTPEKAASAWILSSPKVTN